jgi:hypothetical protein
MKTLDEYRVKLKEIADNAFAYGIRAMGADPFKNGYPDTWDKEKQKKFLSKCHEGFKIAQKQLIEEVIYYQSLLREYTTHLKESRRQRNKNKELEINNSIRIIEQRLSTLSHIADGIAWQLIGGQIHIARRFHIRQDTAKFLDSSNIKHAIEVADSINKNEDDFALISDLTNFVQTGDLLIRHDTKIGIMELKEGAVNDLISAFFEALEKSGELFDERKLEGQFDDNTIKQIKRVERQKKRMTQVTEIINNDKGTDPVSGKPIRVSTPNIYTEYYHDQFVQLQVDLKSKVWAYTVIDGCVHIGMYRDLGILMAPIAIEETLKSLTENYIIIDWLSITENLSEPIFGKPFSPEFIIDVLTGKVKIIIGLDMDMLIELFNSLGLKTRWMTVKETNKNKISAQGIMFTINNKGIVITTPQNKEVILGGGIISKILYDSIKPSNIALTFLSLDSDNSNKEKQ